MLRRLIERFEEGFIALLLAAMTLLTFVQVVLRYVFNSGLVWALEATTYLFAWMVLFGISYGVRKGSHIGVDAVVKAFPPAGQRIIGLGTTLLSLLYAGLVVWGGYRYVAAMKTMGVEAEDIPVERWLLLLILPVGFGLLFVRLLQMGWDILTRARAGFALADEARETIEQLHIGEDERGTRP